MVLDGSAQVENLTGWRWFALTDRERSSHLGEGEHNLLVVHSSQNYF